jgi:hypothetical protein
VDSKEQRNNDVKPDSDEGHFLSVMSGLDGSAGVQRSGTLRGAQQRPWRAFSAIDALFARNTQLAGKTIVSSQVFSTAMKCRVGTGSALCLHVPSC